MSENNPLKKHFRRPTTYITLPSKGMFNPEIDQSSIDDIGLLPMTIADELALKNPEGLFNGDSVISVIESCVPSIPNPRKLPSIDIDAIITTLKLSSYGDDLTQTHTCSECKAISDYNMDTSYILNSLPTVEKIPPIEYEGMKLFLRLPTYETKVKMSIIQLEQKQIFRHISNAAKDADGEEIDTDTEQDLLQKFHQSFNKIVKQNVNIVADTVFFIITEDGEKVENRSFIEEFIGEAPATLIKEINEAIEKSVDTPEDVLLQHYTCPECGNVDKVHLELNPTNFS